MRKYTAITLALVILLSLCCSAYASGIGPYANQYYSDAGVALTSKGLAVFSATTTFRFSKLSITSCTLQIKSGGDWIDYATLTPPSYVAENGYDYDAEKSYSSSLTPGNTYRIKATFNADGHKITKNSGERSF